MLTPATLLLCATTLAPLATGADRWLQQHVDAAALPGVSAAIVVDGTLVYAGAAGVADLETGRAMTADTPLYAGSLSKVFTAVLVIDQVAQHALDLDTQPAFRAPVDAASVADLMTHTAGLAREGDFDYWYSGRFPGGDALVEYLRDTPLDGRPGDRERYSNIGYAVLGQLLEQRAGKDYGELLQERVLGPLGLEHSGYGPPPPGLARGYTPPGRLLPNAERPFAGVGRPVGDRRLREYHDARAMTPAFGLYSTSRDLAMLAAVLLEADATARPVPAGNAGRRLLAATDGGRSLVFGFGTVNDRSVARHAGWFAAHRSYLLLDPAGGTGIAVMANSDDGSPGRLAAALHSLVLGTPAAPPPR